MASTGGGEEGWRQRWWEGRLDELEAGRSAPSEGLGGVGPAAGCIGLGSGGVNGGGFGGCEGISWSRSSIWVVHLGLNDRKIV
jgi:hypothetical protein